jgi:hypothetical protein
LSAEQVGTQAAAIIIKNIQAGGCVDEYMQDQLIVSHYQYIFIIIYIFGGRIITNTPQKYLI